MSEFVNTIDILGDLNVYYQIFNKTIAEFKDDKLTTVGEYAFYSCASLTEVDLPNCTNLYMRSFNYCTNLKKVNIPSVTTIDSEAFFMCKALEIIDFPSCSIIAASSFGNCQKLKAVVLRKSDVVCQLYSINAFADTPIANGTGYIYVPSALLSDDDASKDYRRATNWTTFQFRALEDYTVDGTITGSLDESKI